MVLATKVHGRMHEGPNGAGLSRKAILTQIDHSLRRLGTDYVDLYQIHRWDHHTPVEETMETSTTSCAPERRYIRASSMWAWQFAKAQHVAERNGWTRFVSMQNHYNLLHREEEREMLPLCADQGVGVIPWSPARGRLTRPWGSTTARSETDEFGRTLYQEEMARSSRPRSASPTSAVFQPPRSRWRGSLATPVVAPIIGATKPHHLEDAVASVELELTDDEAAQLEAPYTTRPMVGFA